MKLTKIYFIILTLLFTVSMTACGLDPDSDENGTFLPGDIVIANTNYATGSLSSLNSETMTSSNDILKGTVDYDLRVRSFNGLVYVLNDVRNNIRLLDPDNGFTTLAEESTGAGSNPHDIAVIGDKAYVTLYGSSELLIINPLTLKKIGGIDLSGYKPSDASTPSMDQLWIDVTARKLFVSIDRISYSTGFADADYSSVLVINIDTDKVTNEIKLQWTVSGTTNALNPYSKFVFVSNAAWSNGDGHDHIFVLCQGFWNADWSDKHDGGIVAIDTTDLHCESGFLVSESDLGNAMSDFDYANGKFYIAASSSSSSNLFVVKASDLTTSSLLNITAGFSIPFAKVNSGGLLFVGDGVASGIWIYNTADDTLKNSSVISTGLPPADIALIK